MSQTSRDRVNSRRVRTHERNSGETVRRLGTIIGSIFCAQSGASIRLTVWKWSGESRYPGAFPPVPENFLRAFSPGPTDRPWVSEDGNYPAFEHLTYSRWTSVFNSISKFTVRPKEMLLLLVAYTTLRSLYI